jgi:hypothetical protein
LLIVVLFGFLNIKSVKTYAIPYIFSTTLLLYKLDTLLLKQKNLPVLDITAFFFRIRTQVTTLVLRTSAFTRVLMRKKKPVISNTSRFFCFNSTVSHTYSISYCVVNIISLKSNYCYWVDIGDMCFVRDIPFEYTLIVMNKFKVKLESPDII